VQILYLLLTMLLFSCSSDPVPAEVRDTSGGAVKIFVIDNGVHTSIAVPLISSVMSWDTVISPDYLGGTDLTFMYYEFGWGDKDFYINTPSWKDLRLSVAVKALFWPSSAVMKVDGRIREIKDSQNAASLEISEEHYMVLCKHILSFFIRDNQGQFIKVAPGYDRHDAFFLAHGKYHLFNTSNTWTADALKKINVKTPWLTITSRPVLRKLRKHKEKNS
jgi:uncharacterized protein (TIGR02117 family)